MRVVAGVDIETPRLYPKPGDKIHGIAINMKGSIRIEQRDILKHKKMLEDPKVMKVIHNGAFDCFWLKMQYGITVRNVWDTMLCEQIILGDTMPPNSSEETKKRLSVALDYVLDRYKLSKLTKTKKEMQMSFVGMVPGTKFSAQQTEYFQDDVRFLPQLQALQEALLIRLGLLEIATTIENPLVEVVVDMQARGIGFDGETWETIAQRSELKYNSLLKKLPNAVSNWNSPQQVKKYFQSKGIPFDSFTTAEELLEIYNDKVLRDFVEMRKTVKNVTTYGRSWLEDAMKGTTVDPDGRVRAQFKQILNTGRFACSHPNLQQLPKFSEHRGAFVPRKGYVFVGADFTGQELGIMAAASGEELWIKALLRREDVHSTTASILYPQWQAVAEKGCTFPKKCSCKHHKVLRENAKTINFAIAYGAGPQKIGRALKLNDRDARKLLEKYKKVVPKLTRWLRANADFSIKNRLSFSADPFKRRRTLRDPEDWMLANIGKNNPVQSCGANMTKLAMVSLPDAPFVLQVHDELWLEVKKSEAKKWIQLLQGTMQAAADYCTGIKGLIYAEPTISMSLQKAA